MVFRVAWIKESPLYLGTIQLVPRVVGIEGVHCIQGPGSYSVTRLILYKGVY